MFCGRYSASEKPIFPISGNVSSFLNLTRCNDQFEISPISSRADWVLASISFLPVFLGIS